MKPVYEPAAEEYREKVQAFLAEKLPATWKGIGSLEGKAAGEREEIKEVDKKYDKKDVKKDVKKGEKDVENVGNSDIKEEFKLY